MENLWGLVISGNPIGNNISPGAFKNLKNLQMLYMDQIGVNEINPAWFESLTNLIELRMYDNRIASIPEGTFDSLTSLTYLDIGGNGYTEYGIPGNLFDKMSQLLVLFMDYNRIQNINPQWFQNIPQLEDLLFDFNQIAELPIGVFASITNLRQINLNSNHIRIVSRNAFGNITNLQYADFAGNLINAIDEVFLREAYPLLRLYLLGNLCASETYYSFYLYREYKLVYLKTCTSNFGLIVETATERGEPYSFYNAPSPGILIRVNTDEEVHIALTPFNILWNPSVEIVIGTRNNTVSTIIRNQGQEVVVARSPNIIRPGQWTRLRLTWGNDLILVTVDGQDLPFLGYNLQDIFPVQFYGIRSPESRAVWSIEPVDW